MHLDINECEISNGGCQHQCININGSYTCQCNEGFLLNSNGKTCTGKFWIESSLICLSLIKKNCCKLSVLLAANSKWNNSISHRNLSIKQFLIETLNQNRQKSLMTSQIKVYNVNKDFGWIIWNKGLIEFLNFNFLNRVS